MALLATVCLGGRAAADSPQLEQRYRDDVRETSARKSSFLRAWREDGDRRRIESAAALYIVDRVAMLSHRWLGTRWGLGIPQTSTPGSGKINCGTFVGTVLRDAGFEIDVGKLQRQPSQLIIRSFVGRERTRRFSRVPMNRFLAQVRAMGPGLFIIGLDFHVGFLLQTEDDLRFIHASYVTETVVDEDAATAVPIATSEYRVVGKIVSARNVRDWLRGRRIHVQGNW